LKIRHLCSFAFALIIIAIAALPSFADTAPSATPIARAANDFAGQVMSDGRSGRVGIGTREPAATLDVYQGEIKLGSTGAACTKGLVGTIRFVDDQLWVCNSYGWRPLATSVPPK
jgi:hypothetical protein